MTANTSTWLDLPPYGLVNDEKQPRLLESLQALTDHHYQNSLHYRNIVDHVYGGLGTYERISDIPFIPVSLFKTRALRSIGEDDVFKVLTSSGTTGQAVSRVYLDRETAQYQSRVLVKTMQHILGKHRLPMVIVDHPNIIRDRSTYSARGAGILGMSQFGRKPFYALDASMQLDVDGLQAYLAAAQGQPVFFFGFTFMVWQYLVLPLEQQGMQFAKAKHTLIHSGGWKKLQDMAVSSDQFRARVQGVLPGCQVINFYGMVEQVGSVFFENDLHHLNAPIYADVIIRDPVTLKPLPAGEIGLIQLVSVLPTSYPGHAILTEDLGVIRGVDHPTLTMKGRYFDVLGRVPKAEIRGCSDTFEAAR